MKRKTQIIIRNNISGWAFILPAFLFLFLFMLYPIIHTFILSFQKFNFVYDNRPVFVGINNYIEILKDDTFQKATANTLYFALIYIPAVFILGFIIGFLFSKESLFASKAANIVLFIPMVIPISMFCFMFLFILNPQWGLINSFLKDYLGLPSLVRNWMNNTSTALNVIIVVTIWQTIGFIGLLFMSGIQAIPNSVIEASIIDGANTWRRISSIILPNLRETYMVVGILSIITAIKLYAQVVAMTGSFSPSVAGGPANSTLTLYVATWRAAFINYDMGTGAAMERGG